MSWSFYMEIDTGGPEPGTVTGDLNCTYNVSPMFYKALPFDDGIRGIEGLRGEEALEPLRGGVKAMEDNPDEYKAMNPENGWGSYEGALDTLRELVKWCVEHPKATFRIW